MDPPTLILLRNQILLQFLNYLAELLLEQFTKFEEKKINSFPNYNFIYEFMADQMLLCS